MCILSSSNDHCRFCDKCFVHFDQYCQRLTICIGGGLCIFYWSIDFCIGIDTQHYIVRSPAGECLHLSEQHWRTRSGQEWDCTPQSSRLSMEVITALTVVSAALLLALIAMTIQLAAFYVLFNAWAWPRIELRVHRTKPVKKLQKQVTQKQAQKKHQGAAVLVKFETKNWGNLEGLAKIIRYGVKATLPKMWPQVLPCWKGLKPRSLDPSFKVTAICPLCRNYSPRIGENLT